jgi:predicted HTH domain antitoxin
MDDSSASKPASKAKAADALKRRHPDLAQAFDKQPISHVEMPIWREIRILLAAKLYGADRLSSERAARLAGMPHVEFILNLGFYKVFPLQAELNELERSHD